MLSVAVSRQTKDINLNRRDITMTYKFSFVLATMLALAAVPQIAHAFDKISVTNNGKMPLKVVILDADKFKEIGRSGNDFKKGSFDVPLKPGATKYHWQAFRPGDVEPCQKKRDETIGSISVGCDLPNALKGVWTRWAGICVPTGAGGPIATCCKRQRDADDYCKTHKDSKESSELCDTDQKFCQEIVDKNKNVGKR
jgi:hypothetical protein